jgi:hypothetical protein
VEDVTLRLITISRKGWLRLTPWNNLEEAGEGEMIFMNIHKFAGCGEGYLRIYRWKRCSESLPDKLGARLITLNGGSGRPRAGAVGSCWEWVGWSRVP